MFEREQYIYNIGGVRIGGNPGERATVLAGTIFYSGDKTVSDPSAGVFDRTAAETQIRNQDAISETTGNPALVQVFAESESAMTRYIDFVTEMTDAPFLIDSTDPKVRIAGLRHAEEVGVIGRAIYNSLNVSINTEELQTLSELRPEAAIILAFNPADTSIAGRRAVLEEPYAEYGEGLLSLAKRVGITKPLVDTATTAMGAGAGPSVSFVFVAKSVYGHPTGSGIHNAPSSWPWLRAHKKVNRAAFEACDVASALLVHSMGADFILYGPIVNADRVFPVVAMADVLAAESLSTEFGLGPPENHPFRRLL
ncbi:MAG: tetrahydromethanopterin S-methyltransferase subunit H [Candidatus Thorarchaeota archaeon]